MLAKNYVSKLTDTVVQKAPLIVHIVHRFAVGGLENGLINLVNHTAGDSFRHAIVSMTDYTEFRQRIQRTDIPIFSLQKRNGHDFSVYGRLLRILRSLHPDIVHTRNLGTLEYQVMAALGGFGPRIHGEHGRDVDDPDGLNFKYNLLRRAIRPLVDRYIAVSKDLANWLTKVVGIPAGRVTRVCNGVDTDRFRPAVSPRPRLGPDGFASCSTILLGTVGRMEPVKDPLTLARAFVRLVTADPNARERVRLAVIGDGTLRRETLQILSAAGVEKLAWIAGERNDIPDLLGSLDLFVLPSLREGISNTILEAMASGLPVVATNVGGNPELVVDGETGMLVPPSNPVTMADAIRSYLKDPVKLQRHGQAGRKRAVEHFSIEKMVEGYLRVYDEVLAERGRAPHRPATVDSGQMRAGGKYQNDRRI